MLKRFYPKNNSEIPKLFSVVLDQAFMSITTFITTIVLARTYEKTAYADLVLLFSITIFILGFQSAIISKPYAINLNDFEERAQTSYFNFNLILKGLFTLGTVIVFPLLYFLSFEERSGKVFLLFLTYVIAHSSYFFVRETLLGQRKTRQNLMYGVFCSFGIITSLAFIFFFKVKDLGFFLRIASVVYIMITTIYVFNNYKKTSIKVKEHKKFWRLNWGVGKWLLGSNFLFHVSTNIYPWLLLYITTKDDIAIFGVLMSVAGLVNPILTAFGSYFLPIFVGINKNFEKIKSTVKKWSLVFGAIAIVLIALGYFFGQKIIVLFFGGKYTDLGLVVVYPFVYQAINIFFQPYKIALNAIKRTDVNFWILIPRSIVALILGYFFISRFGLVGVFYSMIIENIMYQILNYVIYRGIIIKTQSQ
ncbi:lipopolysaccharide biosynthesis protein [Costertonia aggregata]|uniref:Polysaccharide biosynthesis protein n=1 Tax=Costertonia aggregata TaxID=343403 RepID=A0A7H9AM90_9FLAO|nr:polysaccharide biosynthesis protein [Costertonia aggregata]QLG44576.1 polysaccharide biosynthesis protein [Costertonia aggregata]